MNLATGLVEKDFWVCWTMKRLFGMPLLQQRPDWDSNIAQYKVHKPKQDAFGDWAAISVGSQYYLFCDFHPDARSVGQPFILSRTASPRSGGYERA